MISDAVYVETLRNCAKWNGRTLCGKKRSDTAIFDQQTHVVQRPTDFLHRHYFERRAPRDRMQVCAYPGDRWLNKPKEISSDSCEMKYFLSASPALNEAIIALSNPNATINPGSNEMMYDQSGTPMRSMYSKYDISEMDISEYDVEEPDIDPPDEDDWGANKKRRKKANQTSTPKPRRGQSSANGVNNGSGSMSSNGTPSTEPRPFICQVCGAKYKSRPGLTYHRIHVHQDGVHHPRVSGGAAAAAAAAAANAAAAAVAAAEESPKSPMPPSPPIQVSEICDFCGGGKASNAQKVAEDLVSCHDCGRSGHPSCLKFTPNMLISTKRHGWQCIECKSCAICGTSEHDDQLLFCDDCDRGFHLYCLKPPLKTPPETDWSCDLCQLNFGDGSSIMMAKAAAVGAKP